MNRELCSLRVLAPKRLLSQDAWTEVAANPTKVMRNMLPTGAYHSSSNWAEVSHQGKYLTEKVLEGYVRVDSKTLETTLKLSGRKGLFLTQLTKENPRPPQVEWVPLVSQESPKQYMARVQQMSSAQGRPMAFRKGGGNCLGLR